MEKYRIVRLNSRSYPFHPLEAELYQLYGFQPVQLEANTPEEIIESCCDADAIINITTELPGDTLSKLKRCRHISHLGIGTDKTDIQAATRLGIVVSNDPYFCIDDVADHTMALIMSLARKLPQMSAAMNLGKFGFARSEAGNCQRLSSSILGLVGFGSIGSAVARRARAFGMHVLAADKYQNSRMRQLAKELDVEFVEINYLLSNADYVSLHLPLTHETYHLIDDIALARMKPTSYLINTARGAIVDEVALSEALRRGKLAGAGIDTYELINVHISAEANPKHPYLDLDNVILTPHVAGLSKQSLEIWARIGVENLVSIASGHWPDPNNVVNKDVKPKYLLKPYTKEIFL